MVAIRIILAAALALSAAGEAVELTAAAPVAVAAGYRLEEIRRSGAEPPRFGLAFSVELPTPGYQVVPAPALVDPEARTVVARVVLVPPKGMVAQVITRSRFTVDLPPLAPGTYAFRLESRREGVTAFTPAMVMNLVVGAPPS